MDYLIFNELSYPFKNKYEAETNVKEFLKTFEAASRRGINRLRLHRYIGQNLYQAELAPGFYLSMLDDDMKTRFKEILTSAPVITDNEPYAKNKNERSVFEISLPGIFTKETQGLGAAYLLDTIALSFLSDKFWDTDHIQNLRHYYSDEEGNDRDHSVKVKHAARPAHMESHFQWLENKKRQSLKNSRDLWERREEFFPNLILCGKVEEQLTGHFGIQSKYFNQIIDRLKKLDNFAGDWKAGSFNDKTLKDYGSNVSGESRFTIQKYGRERRFRLPEGGKELFEKHIKTGDLRFHFFIDEKNHRIYVGYIGSHLRTVTD